MKKLLLAVLVCCMVFGVTGCTKKEKTAVLNVMNWGEYIGEDVIANFEKEYNCKVNYSLYDSNEMLYTKLANGDACDVAIPADYMLERLIKEDMLLPLDYSYMTNVEYLSSSAVAVLEQIDKGCVYSLPYFVATAGIAYDKTKVSLEDLEAEGWGIMKDTKYAGDIFVYNSERDSFMMALKDLGYSANTDDMDEINAAYQWLTELHDTMDPAYVTDEVIDAMIGAEKALAFVYSGDAVYITSENENIGFYIPESGSRLAVDGIVIPKNAENVELANQFINFMLSYESALDNTLTVGYTSCDTRVLAEVAGEGGDFEGNEAYLFDMENPHSELFFDNVVMKEALSELWTKIMMR